MLGLICDSILEQTCLFHLMLSSSFEIFWTDFYFFTSKYPSLDLSAELPEFKK